MIILHDESACMHTMCHSGRAARCFCRVFVYCGVVSCQVLHHWKRQGHKALLFTQTQQMLDIMERAVQAANFRLDVFDSLIIAVSAEGAFH